jgi:signal transduction histidine kinase
MDLRVAVLENWDLPSALAVAASEWSGGTDTSIKTEVSGRRRILPKDLEQNIFRVAQEAVKKLQAPPEPS